jgi:hypothetical protein
MWGQPPLRQAQALGCPPSAARPGFRWLRQIHCPARHTPDFHNPEILLTLSCIPVSPIPNGTHPHPTLLLFEIAPALCTKSGHRPVHRLHSLENTCSYKPKLFIDSKNRSLYKHTRSLTTSKVFPVGAASGARAQSPSAHCKVGMEGGQARVYSKALVEENRKTCRRQDRVPRRWVGLSGWR